MMDILIDYSSTDALRLDTNCIAVAVEVAVEVAV
jgi:hypothetical protein